MKIQKSQDNKGAAMMILLFFFIIISTVILLGIVAPVAREFKISGDSLDSRKSYFLAESGMEDIMYRIKNSIDVGTLGDDRTLFLDGAYLPIPTTMNDGLGDQKSISIKGEVKDRQRTIAVDLTTSTGVSFNYGVLAGQGGINLDSGKIYGNAYANGPITASSSSSNLITGSAISANSPGLAVDQSNGTGTPAYNIIFGNTFATQDVGQSFKVSTDSPINKVSFYIKKIGNPTNPLIKIVTDDAGSPSKNIVAGTSLNASLVTTSYGWVNLAFNENPILEAGKTYWLVIDTSSISTSKYYIIGASNGGYGNGICKTGQQSGAWTSTTPPGLDYYFNMYLGGINGLIQGDGQWTKLNIGTEPNSVAYANTVNAVNLSGTNGTIYCQNGVYNSKTCNTSRPDPVYIEMPVSDSNVAQWEEEAEAGGLYSGNYTVGSSGATIGPKKINGNLTISSGGTLTVSGNIWVTGNLVLNGNGKVKLHSSYGSNDAVIVVDGTISISGGGSATGSGTEGSYIMLYSKSSSSSAATVNGGAGAMIVYAPYGSLNFSGGASLKEATANTINISGNSSITYESGLRNNNFSSGPSGTWSIDSWGEGQ